MGEASIPVDLLNPGQVFACIGFVEAAIVLLGDADGAFDWREPAVRFHLRAPGDASPVMRVLEFLESANAFAEAPAGSPSIDDWKGSWGDKPRAVPRASGYPFPDPPSPASLVCVLDDGEHELRIDHWGDETERDNVKFWAGAGGYPGTALARDALSLIRGKALAAASNPFALGLPQSSSFRLDWRRDYIPIDSGFSLNSHASIETIGYPIVELLAAIGLTHARPARPERRNKLLYTYSVAGRATTTPDTWLPASVLRAALGGAPLPFPRRHFRMFLDWPGQQNQARVITTVTEEFGQ